MHLLGGLVLLIQVAAAVHALKTGRAYWWLYLILFLPGIGGIVYFVSEMLPDLGRSAGVARMGTDIAEWVRPGYSLQKLQEEVTISDSFANRQALARGFAGAGRYDEAIAEYGKCLVGTFKDDPSATMELAYCFFLTGCYVGAIDQLKHLAAVNPRYRSGERDLLLARTWEESGDVPAALAQYAAIVDRSSGEETACRYALLLDKTGQTEKAGEVYEQIMRRARRSPRYYRRAQREWIKIARRQLAPKR